MLIIEPTFPAIVTAHSNSVSRPDSCGQGVGLILFYLPMIRLRFSPVGGIRREVFLACTMSDMWLIYSEPRGQIYPDDDGSDDHLFEGGCEITSTGPGFGGSKCKLVNDEFTAGTLPIPPHSEWYSAYCTHE